MVGSNFATSRVSGTAVGADYLVSVTLVGFALAGGDKQFSVTNGGTGRSDLFQAGCVRPSQRRPRQCDGSALGERCSM